MGSMATLEAMRDKDLYARTLNIKALGRVADLEMNLQEGEVVVHVEHDGEALTGW